MATPDTRFARCRAAPALRRAFYRALARAVAGSRRPAGAVFECSLTAPIAGVVVRPARLLDDLLAEGAAAGGTLDVSETPASPAPPASIPETFGLVRPLGSGLGRAPTGVLPAPLPSEVRLGPGGWLAVQTFCLGGAAGSLWVARRFRYATPRRAELDARFPSVAAAVADDWSAVTGGSATAGPAPGLPRRAWRRRTVGGIPRAAWRAAEPEAVAGLAEPPTLLPAGDPFASEGHTIVFGSSGAGKTTYLARRAAEAIARGEPVVVIDLHGDLAPAVVARLGPVAARRVLAVDAESRPVPGIAALVALGDEDRAAALLVAAVKRLSADGTDVYWGFRLERIFDTFVRLVQESGGSLLDLYDLLTSEDRRESARLATRRPELARFLEELGPVVRRNPDYLWPAATRLSKVALVPALAELLAPADGGLPVERSIAEGRSLLVRLPFARIGSEAATLAGTFVLARVFLGVAGRDGSGGPARPLSLVLDEVHGFAPRLVAELLAEGRKFGFRAIVATQYPDRLAPELRSAAAGTSSGVVVFRVPPASAPDVGAWIGLERSAAERGLPALPPGHGIALSPDLGARSALPTTPDEPPVASTPWSEAVARTRREHAPEVPLPGPSSTDDPVAERLLLAVLAADERGAPLAEAEVVGAALALPGRDGDGALLSDRWGALVRRGWVRGDGGRFRLSPAGERALGLTAPTFAARETDEHRRLLLRTFRIFARHGARLEIVRQGRFDTTLPDARFRPLATAPRTPAELAEAIDRTRRTWAWRFFGGRDVHVEAEVSGALRPERIRHGWAKGAERGAFVLFVVGDAHRARRVRATLARVGAPRDRAQVWTLVDRRPNG